MPAPRPDELPPAVRARVVALAAEALPDVAALPPSLRRVAAFAPARRARLGATALLAALAEDAVRERVAVQVAVRHPGGGAAAGADAGADAGVPAEAGAEDGDPDGLALTWLLRPDGWEDRLAAGLAAAADRGDGAPGEDRAGEDDARRLRRRLERAEQTLRETRAVHREQVAELKGEIAALRRRVGELRRGAAPAPEAAAAAREAELQAELEAGLQAERTARLAAEAEADRLREELAGLRARLAAGTAGVADPAEVLRAARRAARAEREEASARARLLLETVIDAAAGLRRELALPTTTVSPGARREAGYEASAEGGEPASGRPAGSGLALTPGQLERQLALPRARLLVDGYNASKAAWPGASLEVQRQRLLGALAPLVARTGAETTVVFDAAEAEVRAPVHPPRGVRVVFSPRGVIADDVLGDLVEAEPAGRVVVTVSDDREVADRARRAGARTASTASLLAVLTRA